MDTLASQLLDEAKKLGADYADVRHVVRRREWLTVRNGTLETAIDIADQGVGIRVRVDGAWGYAGVPGVQPGAKNGELRALLRGVDTAVGLARASESVTDKAQARPWAPTEPGRGSYRSPMEKDPFEVDLAEKVDLLHRAAEAAGKEDKVVSAQAASIAQRLDTRYWSSEGADLEQSITMCGGGVSSSAAHRGEMQRRSWPKDYEGDVRQAGWEFVESLDLVGEAERVRSEAVALLTADPCPSGEHTVILDGSQLSLHVHETCGHPTELDRAQGEEISLAGGSFLTTDRRGKFRYGSELVNLTADATTPGGPGTFGWDDEGTPAHATPLVSEGNFVGYLSSRQNAARLGLPSAGACRAQSWSSVPIVRMVNVNLEAGNAGSLEDLIASTDRGILMSTNRSWSIDQLRLNFQFACEAAWEIRGGKRTRLLRNPVYTGITPRFWGGCDAICGPESWRMWGYLFCGKGDPIQLMHVGHGVAPARFRNVSLLGA